jgi:hypothetical protein
LYHAEDLPFAIKDIPDVLPISEKNRARCYRRAVLIAHSDHLQIPEMILPTLQERPRIF